jgi:hypothetical protein
MSTLMGQQGQGAQNRAAQANAEVAEKTKDARIKLANAEVRQIEANIDRLKAMARGGGLDIKSAMQVRTMLIDRYDKLTDDYAQLAQNARGDEKKRAEQSFYRALLTRMMLLEPTLMGATDEQLLSMVKTQSAGFLQGREPVLTEEDISRIRASALTEAQMFGGISLGNYSFMEE